MALDKNAICLHLIVQTNCRAILDNNHLSTIKLFLVRLSNTLLGLDVREMPISASMEIELLISGRHMWIS